jgi:hypothetical protein
LIQNIAPVNAGDKETYQTTGPACEFDPPASISPARVIFALQINESFILLCHPRIAPGAPAL